MELPAPTVAGGRAGSGSLQSACCSRLKLPTAEVCLPAPAPAPAPAPLPPAAAAAASSFSRLPSHALGRLPPHPPLSDLPPSRPSPTPPTPPLPAAAASSFSSLQPTQTFRGHGSIATALRGVTGEASLFVSGDKDGSMLLWDLRCAWWGAMWGIVLFSKRLVQCLHRLHGLDPPTPPPPPQCTHAGRRLWCSQPSRRRAKVSASAPTNRAPGRRANSRVGGTRARSWQQLLHQLPTAAPAPLAWHMRRAQHKPVPLLLHTAVAACLTLPNALLCSVRLAGRTT